MQRGLIVEIDLYSLVHNLSVALTLAGSSKIIAVVKANAYGHGAVEVSKALIERGVNMLAVAYVSEGAELRESGISADILSLFDPDPEGAISYRLTPVVSNLRQAQRLSKAASKSGTRLKIHLKIDTGMGRTGFQAEDLKDIGQIFTLNNLEVDGIMSHFSEADLLDKDFAFYQIGQMIALRNGLSKEGLSVRLWHISNSAALMSIPEAHFDAVRPGLMLYGCSPFADGSSIGPLASKAINDASHLRRDSNSPKPSTCLRPVMTVRTEILQLRSVRANRPISYGRTFVTKRDSLIGVLPVGYADGINRLFSNNMDVLVSGKRAPVVGRVCMDTTMIDVTGIEGVSEGSAVVLLGSQGNEEITAAELAHRINTIPYEILTTFGARQFNPLS